MPRYFFDIANHRQEVDEDGTDLPGVDDARLQAVIFAGDYLRDNPGLVCGGSRFSVTVRDERRTELLRVVVTAENPADQSAAVSGSSAS